MRIAYIVGTKNCGSTLLDTLIGQADGVRSLGEIGGLYRYQLSAPCDCGEVALGCNTCAALATALGREGLEEICCLFPRVSKERRILWTLLPTKSRKRYSVLSDQLFDSVAAHTGAELLVDSTKNIGRAAALAQDSRHDVMVIHLIRDGRGFLTSRRHRSPLEGLRYSAIAAQAEWLLKNLAIWLLLRPRLKNGRYLLCRYEDLVLDPAAQLRSIASFLNISLEDVAERACTEGVARQHVYEPARAQNYALVRFNPSKLLTQRLSGAGNLLYWIAGGFVSRIWKYDYGQSYIDSYLRQVANREQ